MKEPKRDIDAEIEAVKERTRKCAAEIQEMAEDAPDETLNCMLDEVDKTLVLTRQKKDEVESGIIPPEHATALKNENSK